MSPWTLLAGMPSEPPGYEDPGPELTPVVQHGGDSRQNRIRVCVGGQGAVGGLCILKMKDNLKVISCMLKLDVGGAVKTLSDVCSTTRLSSNLDRGQSAQG